MIDPFPIYSFFQRERDRERMGNLSTDASPPSAKSESERIDVSSDASPPAKSESLFLQIVEYLDGTISRPLVPIIPPTESDPSAGAAPGGVRSRDVPLNPSAKTSLRLYLPSLPPSSTQKLPIILFFHGGGFILFTSASAPYHLSCIQMAESLPALILSLDYRLAPEHRLPSAYSDAVDAILWLQSHAVTDPWISAYADPNRFFLAGSSSGANIAFHTALLVADLDLNPLKLHGIILNQPYLGGVERTPSEAVSEEDAVLPLRANDMMWRLALPAGADRDHEYCNPAASLAAERIAVMPARCLVKGRRGDPLIDRQRELVRAMEEAGVNVTAQLEDEGFHAIELFEATVAEALFTDVREFMEA